VEVWPLSYKRLFSSNFEGRVFDIPSISDETFFYENIIVLMVLGKITLKEDFEVVVAKEMPFPCIVCEDLFVVNRPISEEAKFLDINLLLWS